MKLINITAKIEKEKKTMIFGFNLRLVENWDTNL